MELYILAALLVGIVIGGWLGQRKFVANAGHIQRVEYRGRLFKVYDVTGLWHLDEDEYRVRCFEARERFMSGRCEGLPPEESQQKG